MKTKEKFPNLKKPWEVEEVEWKEVRLGDVCEYLRYSINPSEYPDEEFLLFSIPSYDIRKKPEKVLGKEVRSSKLLIDNGICLFSKLNPRKPRIWVVNGYEAQLRKIASTEFIPIKPFSNALDLYYLGYFLSSNTFLKEVQTFATGATGSRQRIKPKVVFRIQVPIPFRNGKPDLETQRRIVEYIEANFEKIDRILEKKKRELERLDELWESVLEQAFRPKEGEEWREVRLGNLIELKYGKGLPKRVRQEGYIPVYGSNGIIGYHNESLTNSPTIIIGRKGSAGETWLSLVPCWVIDTAFYVELKEERLDWKYLYSYTKLIKRNLVFPKGVKPGINRRDYLNVNIPIPFRNGKLDLEKQREIASYLDNVYEKIKTLKKKIQNQINLLEEMKESILEEVFGG